jgi:hypothetical protein
MIYGTPPVLTYFPIRGRAEPIRLLLEDAQIKYEDNRNFNWQQEKPNRDKYPFGQLPAISFGSLHIVQQDAILRHLAREHNYYGTLPEEMADADMIAGAVEDLKGPYGRAIYGGDFVIFNGINLIRKMLLDPFWKRMQNLGWTIFITFCKDIIMVNFTLLGKRLPMLTFCSMKCW